MQKLILALALILAPYAAFAELASDRAAVEAAREQKAIAAQSTLPLWMRPGAASPPPDPAENLAPWQKPGNTLPN